MLKKKIFLGAVLFGLLSVSLTAMPELITQVVGGQRLPDELAASVLGGAGAPTTGTSIHANGTLGQATPIGIAWGSGKRLYAGFWGVRDGVLTDVETPEALVYRTDLIGNAPNPFNPTTTIEFTLARDEAVRLEVFSAKGELVRTLLDEQVSAGRYSVAWKGDDRTGRRAASGVYFYRLRAGEYESVKKMLMLK